MWLDLRLSFDVLKWVGCVGESMSHSHSFGREADGVYWDGDDGVMVVERECTHRIRESGIPGSTLSGGMVVGGGRERSCGAVEEVMYEIGSVVDVHDVHEGTHCVVVSDNRSATTEGAVHISEFEGEEVPEWVGEIVELVKGVVDGRDVGLMMCELSGAEVPMTVATSETEYTVVFSRVGERVVE